MACGEITKWSERKEPRRLTRVGKTVEYFTTGRKLTGMGAAKITHRQPTQKGTTKVRLSI